MLVIFIYSTVLYIWMNRNKYKELLKEKEPDRRVSSTGLTAQTPKRLTRGGASLSHIHAASASNWELGFFSWHMYPIPTVDTQALASQPSESIRVASINKEGRGEVSPIKLALISSRSGLSLPSGIFHLVLVFVA